MVHEKIYAVEEYHLCIVNLSCRIYRNAHNYIAGHSIPTLKFTFLSLFLLSDINLLIKIVE